MLLCLCRVKHLPACVCVSNILSESRTSACNPLRSVWEESLKNSHLRSRVCTAQHIAGQLWKQSHQWTAVSSLIILVSQHLSKSAGLVALWLDCHQIGNPYVLKSCGFSAGIKAASLPILQQTGAGQTHSTVPQRSNSWHSCGAFKCCACIPWQTVYGEDIAFKRFLIIYLKIHR